MEAVLNILTENLIASEGIQDVTKRLCNNDTVNRACMSETTPRGKIISSAPRKNFSVEAGNASQYLTYVDVIAKRKDSDEDKRLEQDRKEAKPAQAKKAQINPKKVNKSGV